MSERRDGEARRRHGFDAASVDELLETGGGALGTQTSNRRSNDPNADDAMRWIGVEVGAYRITRYLDRGGMSLVFAAQRADGQFEQEVAVKVLRTPDASDLALRFEQERRFLAQLQHPGIAHIVDSGVVQGQPWIAMELVIGEPIDRYCDRKHLSLDSRLALFMQVASAVQFAHGSLVIHRDLKPNNILVDAEGRPKLLDFGIAKALQADVNLDLTGDDLLLTPRYASPEQVLGDPVGVASDVYQLGLLLYRLLTGSDAQDMSNASVARIKSVVVDETPLSPSSRLSDTDRKDTDRGLEIAVSRATSMPRLCKTLSGDLDAIVLHALEKDPSRRYATVQQLIDDLENFRESRPVTARSAGQWYRFSRFAQRHKGGVTAAALALFALVLGVALATLGMVRAQKAEAVARQEAEKARVVSDFMIDVFDVNDPRVSAGEDVTARQLLDAAIGNIDDELASQPLLRATMMERIGVAYTRLGSYPRAQELLERALEIHTESVGDELARTQVEFALGELHRDLGKVEDSERYLRSAMETRARLLGHESRDHIDAMASLGYTLSTTDRVDESIELLTRALKLMSIGDSDVRAAVLNNLALALDLSGNSEQALPLFEGALAMQRRLGKSVAAAETLDNVAMANMDKGHYRLAEEQFREVLEVLTGAYGPDHPDLIISTNNLAHVLKLQGRYAQAAQIYRQAQALSNNALTPDHWQSTILRLNIANVTAAQGRFEQALPEYRRAVNDLGASLGEDNPLSHRVKMGLAGVLLRTGALDEATAELERVAEKLKTLVGADHQWVAQADTVAAEANLDRGALAEAEVRVRVALATQATEVEPTDPFHIRALVVLARAHQHLAVHGEAVQGFERAHALVSDQLGVEHPNARVLQRQLCEAQRDAGLIAEAATNCAGAKAGLQETYPNRDAIQLAEALLAQSRLDAEVTGCDAALDDLTTALRMVKSISGELAFATWPFRADYADCLNRTGEFQRALEESAEAREVLRRALRGSTWQKDVVDTIHAEALAGTGELAGAQSAMSEAVMRLRDRLPNSPITHAAQARAARVSDQR